ncbi:MAG: type II secretion system GspH family protein [Candidatus Omnitrophica bacterium]|nr:type II secretion system GspH family protein [Candidatus Omnitrophota bacterium]
MANPMSVRQTKKAFTLIEMLVVIAILSILISLIAFTSRWALDWARASATEAMIAGLESALEMYQHDLGTYPASGNANLVTGLADVAAHAGNTAWNGPYMNFRAQDLQGGQVIDGWKNAYHYTFVVAANPPVRIWSNGPDKVDNNGAGDDIKSKGW